MTSVFESQFRVELRELCDRYLSDGHGVLHETHDGTAQEQQVNIARGANDGIGHEGSNE